MAPHLFVENTFSSQELKNGEQVGEQIALENRL
jgi:hypothetical protein